MQPEYVLTVTSGPLANDHKSSVASGEPSPRSRFIYRTMHGKHVNIDIYLQLNVLEYSLNLTCSLNHFGNFSCCLLGMSYELSFANRFLCSLFTNTYIIVMVKKGRTLKI